MTCCCDRKQIEFYVRFEVFTTVTVKNAIFWDVAPCRFCVNQHIGEDLHRATSQKTAFFKLYSFEMNVLRDLLGSKKVIRKQGVELCDLLCVLLWLLRFSEKIRKAVLSW
jgi:hypothetical protein